MEPVVAAEGFSAMGSESRLAVLQTLVRAGDDGLPVGAIQERTAIPASTLAHHLKFLNAAGLVVQEKLGRTIMNKANYERLQRLATYILEECCSEQCCGPDCCNGACADGECCPDKSCCANGCCGRKAKSETSQAELVEA